MATFDPELNRPMPLLPPKWLLLSGLQCVLSSCVFAAPPLLGGCPVLPGDHVFNSRIDDLPVHPQSAAFLATISTGTRRLHLDLGQNEDPSQVDTYWGIPFNLVAGASMAWPQVFITADGAADESDCARADGSLVRPCTGLTEPARLPIAAQPLVEGGISSNTAVYNDHHILSLDTDRCWLWESYLSYLRPDGAWNIDGSAAFDLQSHTLRPAGWTSADAAGFPILPLLLRADEANTGEIRHALRFTIQSSKIRTRYTWPARHLTRNGNDADSKPPMGQLFRLKASYPLPANATVQTQAILNALKRYGMYLADGGSDMYITGTPNATWSDTTISQVQSVPHTAFEAVELTRLNERPGFNPDSGRVPPAEGASAVWDVASEGPISQHTAWASLQVAQADDGTIGQLYLAAWVPGVGWFSGTESGWRSVAAGVTPSPTELAQALLPYQPNTVLGSHLLPLARRATLNGYSGTQIYLGYGRDLNDMLSKAQYRLIHQLP